MGHGGKHLKKKKRALNVWGQTKKGVDGLVARVKVAIEISQLTEPVGWLVIMSRCNDSNIILFVVVAAVLMPRPYGGC